MSSFSRSGELENSVERVVEVPQKAVGKAIGKGGDNIKRIRHETGVRIEVDQSTKEQGFSRFVVTAAHGDQIERAVEQLNEIIQSCESCDFFRPGDTEKRVPLPEDRVGDVIGPRACVLDELKRRSGCRMDVVVKVPSGEMKYARIVGPPEAGSGGRFDGPMNPQGQWNSPYENPGRNWKSPLPAPPGAMVKFEIPSFAYEKVMGVDNDVLRRISRETSTQISELAGRGEIGQATLLLESASQTAVDAAIRELEEVIFTCEKPIPGPEESQEFLPMNATNARKMGGYRSCVIDDLKKRSGCRMEITLARPDADADDNMLTIVGNAEQVKVGMMLASQVLSGQMDYNAIESKFKEAHACGKAEGIPMGPPIQDGVRRSVSRRASPY
ncbi:conserved hypothetical protein [Perkinsus marinus ATCC 50983]|uniref:K Homology domain-containing protein n=1 Tax=Perkinsus marinus (strain ATCC 50983 / TXsc) TaxID=423536 RepID=C5LYN4_PERM5|nr:conserved hypothetical protein [Perkinsus marinus ATCC 50983]EEQ98272.1 conserved hypothetical protein [Perkinsus marinus ATCC 50983]|eukprot:XP_002765555.1 conserved hypothetical protein [Perkinsus marinus ATCC 50983]